MAWTGDKSNPVPNIGNVKGDLSQKIAQDSSVLSEKINNVNRAYQTRRDNDTQKNFTIGLEDIDTAVAKQLEKFQLTITDAGNRIIVPHFYGSPERWKSIQHDGVIRDYNGKLILPAIAFQRTSSDKDETMKMFNRYLTYSVIRTNSPKNKYTQFNILMGKNAPVHEVYDVVMPKHMVFTYHFIIWTELIQQMNELVGRFNFETDDYWGDLRGLRFRTKIESFGHTVEIQTDQDRMVKTEFDLTLNGYLLPDIIELMKGKEQTTRKWLTPKKVIMGMEVVDTGFNLDSMNTNLEKWRSQYYPNIQKDFVINSPPSSWSSDISIELLSGLKSKINVSSGIPTVNNSNNVNWAIPPVSPTSPGIDGSVSYDSQYLYIFSNGYWKRLPLNLFT